MNEDSGLCGKQLKAFSDWFFQTKVASNLEAIFQLLHTNMHFWKEEVVFIQRCWFEEIFGRERLV